MCVSQKKLIIDTKINDVVHLCSSHRVLRMQPFDSSKGYMQHFNLLGLCSGGGRGIKDDPFVIKWIREHISMIIEMINNLKKFGLSFSNISVNLSDIKFLDQLLTSLCLPRSEVNRYSLNDDFDLFQTYQIKFPREIESISDISKETFESCGLVDQTAYYTHLEKGIILPLRKKYPLIPFCFDFTRKAGLGYYKHVCFHVFATTQDGNRIQVADGGAVDWLEKFLQNKKEHMVTSGIGSELIHKLFMVK